MKLIITDLILPAVGLVEIIFSNKIITAIFSFSLQKKISGSEITVGRTIIILQGLLFIYGGLSPLFDSMIISVIKFIGR